MFRAALRVIFVVVSLGAASAPVLAQSEAEVNARADMLFGEHEGLQEAFEVIKSAVAEGDAETLASLVKYPFEVTIDGEAYVLEDEVAFIENYEGIITPAVADTVDKQSYAELFLNSDGAMFGEGQLWLTAVCTDESCASSYWVISAVNN